MGKVLIIAHSAMDENTNNGRTLLELFGGIEKSNLAQLVLHPNKINPNYCDTTYQLTEIDIIKHFFRREKIGKIIIDTGKEQILPNETVEKLYRKGSKKKSGYVLARNIIWDTTRWFNKKLKAWLREYNPDIIFYVATGSTFSIKVTRKISKYLSVPIVTYWLDDYYLNNTNRTGFFGLLNNCIYKSQVKKLMKDSDYISLTDLMKEQYDKEFCKQGECIYTTSCIRPFDNKQHSFPLVMSFMGNISLDRYKSIADIAQCIVVNNLPIVFNLYTAEKREWILKEVVNVPGLNYCGEIKYDAVKDVMRESDILVHVENFDDDTIAKVKYSLSTKIADSLSSNRCLFAYGPAEVSSMDYLIKNNCAIIATNRQELTDRLKELVDDVDILDKKAEKGFAIAEKNHNPTRNHAKLHDILERVIEKA